MSADLKEATNVEQEKPVAHKEPMEFGGPIGTLALMIWSHYILLYFWYCFVAADGQMIIPLSMDSLTYHLKNFGTLFVEQAVPDLTTWGTYFSFFVVQILLAAVMPGLTMYGIPTAPDGKRLVYHCNGYFCYYFCLYGFFFADYFEMLSATHMAENYGKYLIAAMIIGDVTSVYWYFVGITTSDPRNTYIPSGSAIYDFFMGTILYPRIGEVDIKMIAEVRWSWLTLMLLTLSCAIKQYRTTGRVSYQMALMVYAHWLYSNATVKGEQYIPATWDMFHEKYGWMLNFWNICGVPYLYCYQSYYILQNQELIDRTMNPYFCVFIFFLLTLAYYIFDCANCQKASTKLNNVKRNLFPAVPWGILENPQFMKTPKGNLLIDGFYAYARKIQYTGDILMALSWGLATGFGSPLNYFYCLFFTCMINHRQWRDEIKCSEKYGEHWKKYTSLVPNVFFPSAAFYVWLFTGKKPEFNLD